MGYVLFTIFPLGFVILQIIPLHILLALFVSERMLIVGQPMIRIKAAGIKRQRHALRIEIALPVLVSLACGSIKAVMVDKSENQIII